MVRRWIQKAVKREGALRRYVLRRFGSEGFTERGTIKVSVLRRLARDPNVSKKTRLRARLALTLRRFARRRRRKRRRR